MLLIFISFSKKSENQLQSLNIYINKERSIYSNIINYKGEKLLKDKLINDYLLNISDEYIAEKKQEKQRFNKYYYLYDYSNNPIIKSKLKLKFFEYISRKKKQTTTQIDIFYLSNILNFGNNLLALNNALFFCEFIGCHKIILNNHNLKRKWLITKPVYIKKSNITIMQGSDVSCNNNNVLCFYEISWCIYYPELIIPQLKTDLIKSEILRNLPKINIEPNILFIHIRGGDIFQTSIGKNYAQPLLCYYEKVIKNNKFFKNIYIISMDHSNVVVDALLNKYKNIIFKKNTFVYDLSLLCYAYNIVVLISSFAFSAIKLNDNLKNLWEYDMMRLSNKFLFLHHHIFSFKRKYKIHTMKPSDIYRTKMFTFKRSSEQIKLMLEDKCPYDFEDSNPIINE